MRRFKTIDGRLLERKVGEVLIEYIGEKATRMVVFAEKGDAEVNPMTKQLRKAEALHAL